MIFLIGFLIVVIAAILFGIWVNDNRHNIVYSILLIVLFETVYSIIFILYYITFDAGYIQEQKELAIKEAENLRRAQIPHVIREADGCKVYEFLAAGRYQFFTRCKDSIITTNDYEVCKEVGSGKSLHKECHIEHNDIQTVK